jgi:hypothetical protein
MKVDKGLFGKRKGDSKRGGQERRIREVNVSKYITMS